MIMFVKVLYKFKNYYIKKERKYLIKPDLFLLCDEKEKNRIMQEYYMIQKFFCYDFKSPINELLNIGIKILSYGFGSNIWSKNMCNKYKNSEFFNISISPFYEYYKKNIKYKNNHIIKHQFKDTQLYKNDTFDFIHQRLICSIIEENECINIINNVFRICKSNGWVEFLELNFNIYDAQNELGIFNDNLNNMFFKYNINPFIVNNISKIMKDVGFIDIKIETYKCYTNDILFSENIAQFLLRYKSMYKKMDTESYEKIIKNLYRDDKKSYVIYYIIYGMKP